MVQSIGLEDIPHQIWDAAKAVLREKFIAINAYI